jgi:Reverse transcriptase (RNA-dependent DNA polymerase)
VENGDSDTKPTLCGVPQGSVLGPLLYICYSNDVAGVIEFCRFHAYADDLQLYHSADVSDLQRCYDEVNADLGRISEWARKNGLKLNPKKSQVMLIHRLTGDVPQPHLMIDSDTVKIGPKAVNLGFVINSRLTPVDHYSKLCQKIYWILRSIKPHASCTPIEVRKKLVQTLILSHVSYSNVVYAHIDSASSRKLGAAFNACLRYVHGIRRRDGVSELQTSISGLTLKDTATLQILKFLFKIMHTRHPSYIFSLFR